MVLVFVILTVVFAGVALFTYRQRGWGWVSIGMAFTAVFIGLGSILEGLVLRIE